MAAGYFDFLDDLRASGDTNMFGAAPYLVDAFDLSNQDARHILGRWMKTFGARNPKTAALDRKETSCPPKQ